MKQFIRYSCLGLALLLAGGQAYAQQQGFGLLETSSEASARARAAAWLAEAGKKDQATLQQFDTLWNQKDRTIVDRLGESFGLGNADAAALLSQARNPASIPGAQVPGVLTDESQSPFFRANLGLAYARILSSRKAYDEGLDVLKLFQPEQTMEPAAYLFHRAVCEHALLKKDDTTRTINRLLTDALDAPERYKTVSLLMMVDMQNWQEKDLGAVARLMNQIQERLDLAKAGPKTQELQKKAVLRLDEIIKEAENKANKKKKDSDKDGPPKDPKDGPPGGGGNGPPKDDCPEGGDEGDGNQGDGSGKDGQQPQSKKASDPLKDSKLPGGSGDGRVDQAAIKKLQEQWFQLPPREREQFVQRLTAGMSPSHRQAIENYFRNIALEQNRPPRR